MKKLISLAIAMFFATAAFAEGYAASDKITQKVLSGQLKQTVMLGDEIETTKISYENIKENLNQTVSRHWVCRKLGPIMFVKSRGESNVI